MIVTGPIKIQQQCDALTEFSSSGTLNSFSGRFTRLPDTLVKLNLTITHHVNWAPFTSKLFYFRALHNTDLKH